jgi:hypothetical protein
MQSIDVLVLGDQRGYAVCHGLQKLKVAFVGSAHYVAEDHKERA